MYTATDTAIQAAAAIVEDYFATPVRVLVDWVDPFAAQVARTRDSGSLTRSKIDALVRPPALQTTRPGRRVRLRRRVHRRAIDLLADALSHLARWQGNDRRQLVLASQSLNNHR